MKYLYTVNSNKFNKKAAFTEQYLEIHSVTLFSWYGLIGESTLWTQILTV